MWYWFVKTDWLYGMLMIGIILAVQLIDLPEDVLGKENSPYEFNDRGYYERFGEAYEQDNGYTYFRADIETFGETK